MDISKRDKNDDDIESWIEEIQKELDEDLAKKSAKYNFDFAGGHPWDSEEGRFEWSKEPKRSYRILEIKSIHRLTFH